MFSLLNRYVILELVLHHRIYVLHNVSISYAISYISYLIYLIYLIIFKYVIEGSGI